MTTAFLIFSLYWKMYAPLYLGIVILSIFLLLKKSKKIEILLPTDAPTIAFFCSSFLSWMRNGNNGETTASLLINVVGFSALSWASRASKAQRDRALLISIAIPIIEMMGRILGRILDYDWLWLEPVAPWLSPGFYGWRPLSFAGDWMDYSIWILLVIPIGMKRGYWWYVIPSLIILLFGGSRSALLSLAIIFIGEWMIKRVPRRLIMGYVFFSFVIFSMLFLSGMNYGDRERIAGGNGKTSRIETITTSNGRFEMWNFAYEQWRSAPWLGNGGGSYHFGRSGGGYESDHPHNQILWVLSEYGVIGFVCFVFFLWRARHYYEPHIMGALTLYSMLNVVGGIGTLTVLAFAANFKKGDNPCT